MEYGIRCVESRIYRLQWDPWSISADLMESVSLESEIQDSESGIQNPATGWDVEFSDLLNSFNDLPKRHSRHNDFDVIPG